MSLHALANDMAAKGRYGDSMLVHMAPNEVAGLHALALAHGEKLTINPQTGLPEAFSLKSLLPAVLGFALAPLTAGTSLAFLGASPLAAALTVGGAYGLAKGSLKEGLLAGLGAYGGAGLAQGLATAGASEIASEEVLKQQAGQLPLEGTSAAEASLGAPTAPGTTTTVADVTGSASPVAEVTVSPVQTTTQLPGSPATINPGDISTAAYTPPTGLESLSRGAQSIYDQGRIGEFAKLNKNNLYAIGTSALLSPENEEDTPETKRDPGYIRPARYDWRTGKYEYFEPVKSDEWGSRNLSEYTYAGDPNARTPIGAKAGGLMALANGGAIAFAEGGYTEEERLASISRYLQTNPSAEALAAAADYYQVSETDLARAREYGNVGSAPGSNVAGAPTGTVVGGGGYDVDFRPSGGTVEQGYSQNYTPEQMVAIRGTFKQYENDPQKLMSLMDQYGVNVKDLSLAMGGSEQGYQNKFLTAGADPSFGGMNKYQATDTDKAYIDWLLTQPNPLGQGTLGDMYKKQGIDPYTDPRVATQAREQNDRVVRRTDMYGGTATAPMEQIAPWQDPNWKAKQDAAAKAERERQARMLAAQGKNVTVGGGIVTPTSGGGGTTPGPGTGPGTGPGPTNPQPGGPTNPQPPNPTTPTISQATSGGSQQAYGYLSNQNLYPVNPYLPTGTPIAKPIYETPGYEALKPKPAQSLYSSDPSKKPTGNPGIGYEWVWKEDQKKWVSEKTGSSTTTPANNDPTKMPTTDPGPGSEWVFEGGRWVIRPITIAKNGGIMRMAQGGMPGYALGGLGSLGGYSDGGRLLRGPGDGVSDSIPATIGNKRPARLADGEFVVPARIVSELGNGSTEAGARKLYAMMDRVQKARGSTTGKGRVAKNSRADKYLPA